MLVKLFDILLAAALVIAVIYGTMFVSEYDRNRAKIIQEYNKEYGIKF